MNQEEIESVIALELEERIFPLWSAQEYAELCKVNGWENCEMVL